MEMNMKMILAISAIGVLSLVMFAQMLGNSSNGGNYANGNAGGVSNQIPLGNEVQKGDGTEQLVEVKALGTGYYDKQEIRVKAGVPVRFRFSAEARSGCGKQMVLPDFGVNMVSRNGETQEAVFTPQKGTFAYRCGMNMFRGKLIAE